MPKISILIPVYNVEKYLRECLDSAIEQTEKDIEIICVDDASEDNSLEILQEYENKDTRIRLLKHSQNMGLCKTRKDAVEIATGRYILFLDSDDYLSLNACEELYKEVIDKKVDFLQFGTNLLKNENVSNEMYEWVENFLHPSLEDIESDNLVKECFVNHKFNCNLWNKIYKREICQMAYNQIEDGKYTSAEDRYAMFLICYYARTYIGIRKKYYYYRIGVGVTGGTILDLERFRSRCQAAFIVKNVRDFIKNSNTYEKYKEEFEEYKRDILLDCIDCWYKKLEPGNQKEGYDILVNSWGYEEIISLMGRNYFEDQKDILKKIKGKNNKAIYFRSIGNKEIDSIIKQYIEYLSEDNKVYLMTDEDAPEKKNIYLGCELIHLPSATEANWEQYRVREDYIIDIIKQKNIKEIFYFSPTSHVAALDEMVITALDCKFSIYLDEYVIRKERNVGKKKVVKRIIKKILKIDNKGE